MKRIRTRPILKRKLVGTDDAIATERQHKKPCADCPFARTALEGWLGGHPVEMWLGRLHGDLPIECHCTTNQQCAGAAIMRANMCKVPRSPDALELPPDSKLCFSHGGEFAEHHQKAIQFVS